MDTQTLPRSASTSPRTALRGLVIAQEDSYSCPLAFCDGCGAPIKNIDHAGVVWRYPKAKNGRTRFLVLCKFRENGALGCLSDPFYRLKPWMELGAYLMNLLYNTGVKTPKQLRSVWDRADVAARFE